MKRSSVFAVTEQGTTRYCFSNIYGGLAGVALRLCKNAADPRGNPRPFFDRLDRVTEMGAVVWQEIADHPEKADEFHSFIEIDADHNKICVDEDMGGEREYHEFKLDRLLLITPQCIRPNLYTGYPSIPKDMIYGRMINDAAVRARQTGKNRDER